MTSTRFGILKTDLPNVPEGALAVAPGSVEELAGLLRESSEAERSVQVRGGGSRLGYGTHLPPDVVLSMERFDQVVSWDPDDMTVVVGAGMPIERLEAMVAERSLTTVLPEIPGPSTVGGAISAGASSLRRGRLYGTRERMLEVTLVTGDGRVVRGGGRVVKNVTGYDLPRLVVGAFGSLGVLISVCLKLWPVPEASATVTVDDLAVAGKVSRPLAVLETNSSKTVYLWGTEAEVDALTGHLEGKASSGLHWPADPEGPLRWSLRVPPALTAEAVSALPDGWDFLALHGVGEVRAASHARHGALELREWAESIGGHLVVVDAPPAALPDDFDPWGSPPAGLELQRRIISQFDPMRVINPGRLPGGL